MYFFRGRIVLSPHEWLQLQDGFRLTFSFLLRIPWLPAILILFPQTATIRMGRCEAIWKKKWNRWESVAELNLLILMHIYCSQTQKNVFFPWYLNTLEAHWRGRSKLFTFDGRRGLILVQFWWKKGLHFLQFWWISLHFWWKKGLHFTPLSTTLGFIFLYISSTFGCISFHFWWKKGFIFLHSSSTFPSTFALFPFTFLTKLLHFPSPFDNMECRHTMPPYSPSISAVWCQAPKQPNLPFKFNSRCIREGGGVWGREGGPFLYIRLPGNIKWIKHYYRGNIKLCIQI